jgi:uncharacterized GH25 family protein
VVDLCCDSVRLLATAWFVLSLLAELPAGVRVRVTVTDGSTNRRIAGSYVALYAPDDPWRRPSFETVTPDGRVTFTAPPGSYQLFAGAPGYELSGRTVEVAPGDDVIADLSLLPSTLSKSGTVSDATGKPLAGARVSQVRVPLSDRAREQLAQPWSTTTDANGWWRLPVPSDANLPLLIEAAGYAPARHVSRPAEAAMPLDVVLEKGEPAATSTEPTLAGPTTTLFLPRISPRDLGKVDAWRAAAHVESTIEAAAGGALIHVQGYGPAEQFFALTTERLIVPSAAPGPSSKRSVPAVVYPRGEVKLRVVSATEGLKTPREGTVTYRDCPLERHVTLPMSVAADGAITLPAPVDCHTLSLALAPLETLALPVILQKQESRWLGEFRLTAAAEAGVHVTWDPSGLPAAQSAVRATIDGPDRPLVVAEGVTDGEGRLVLTGLPADEELTLEARSERASTVGTASVRVVPGTRASVDPLPLPEPATLTVTPRLSQRFQDFDPAAKIVALVLDPDGREGKRASRTDSLDDKGSVTFSDIRPGRWIVRAIVASSEQAQPIEAAEVLLAAGEDREVEPELEPLIFHGRLVTGENVTRASIGIADPRSWNGIRRRIRPLPDGTWLAILPRAGTYDVTVHLGEPSAGEIDVGEVLFADSSRAIDIRVPQSSVLVAVRKKGEPVAGAAVTLTLRRELPKGGLRDVVQRGVSDAQGDVRFRNLTEGRWLAKATGENQHAAERTAVVARDAETRVQIDLEPAKPVRGVVRYSAGAPAAGAVVECLFASPNGPALQRAESDAEGRFTFELTSEPPLLRCTATSRDRLTGVYLLRPSATMDLVLPIADAAIRFTDWAEHVPSNDLWLIAADGRVASVTSLTRAALIPHFPPGAWKLVRIRGVDQWSMIANGMTGSSEVLEEVRLEAGQVKVVTLYGERGGSR